MKKAIIPSGTIQNMQIGIASLHQVLDTELKLKLKPAVSNLNRMTAHAELQSVAISASISLSLEGMKSYLEGLVPLSE
ncbi:hypothetical protein [Algoriphagus sp. Y33]|uniref:hypothetical protein n=1 Tax=Algoriphagus sp. Y33 TaxID=2772483 RepID=UPI0017858837|nr:hypothetical protein [Algoriphagus sp. Y33]